MQVRNGNKQGLLSWPNAYYRFVFELPIKNL
jgi:hypothetical protein